MNHENLERYIDSHISSFVATTATDLSRLLDGEVSHDAITLMLLA